MAFRYDYQRPLSSLFVLSTLLGSSAWTQQPVSAQGTGFEASSIRPARVEPGCYSILPPGGTQYAITCVTLRQLIAMAWKLHPDNIEGGDANALSTYYDLRATVPAGQPWTPSTVQPMLRQFLIDRFHVAAHRGTKKVGGYALTVAKGGPKLRPAESDSAQQGIKAGQSYQNYIVPGAIQGRGADLSLIAALSGVYNIDLHYATEDTTGADAPDLFEAVEQQLGLSLRPEKITLDTLVIDHVDNEPTPN
jgi:uncharacterized protein (TIGR03435 family)